MARSPNFSLSSIEFKYGRTAQNRVELTDAQNCMWILIVEGQCNKDIAKELGISVETVKRHVSDLMNRTGMSSRLELCAKFLQIEFDREIKILREELKCALERISFLHSVLYPAPVSVNAQDLARHSTQLQLISSSQTSPKLVSISKIRSN